MNINRIKKISYFIGSLLAIITLGIFAIIGLVMTKLILLGKVMFK